MSGSIFKKVLDLIGRDDDEEEHDRPTNTVNMLNTKSDGTPRMITRLAFVYDPNGGTAQTFVRLTAKGKALEICRMRFGENPHAALEHFEDREAAEAVLERSIAELVAGGCKVADKEDDAFTACCVRAPELERAVRENPSDEMLQVYADYLLERGDLRGELIQMMILGKDVTRWLKRNEQVLLGPLAHRRYSFRHHWSRGFLQRVELVGLPRPSATTLVEELFALPAAMLLEELVAPRDSYERLIDVPSKPASLKHVRFT